MAKKPAATWADVDAAARGIEQEQGPHGARVTLITTNADGAPSLWHGTFGNAAVVAGDSTVISLSDGLQTTV